MQEDVVTRADAAQYDENQIQVLEGLEAVRKRPGMYIATTSSRGLHHLVYEIVDNSIDEVMNGGCTHINVTIREDDSITVEDNGKEKRKAVSIYVQASNITDANKLLQRELTNLDCEVISITRSPILEVYRGTYAADNQ